MVKVDPNQIEQIIINLAVNARDAMPSGGELVLETADIYLDEEYCKEHVGIKPGNYVMLAFSDSGYGMSEEVKRHLFEPFFTTKPQGKGTGLGLATIFGAVSQNNGSIYVYSELGKGTTFKIYFPRIIGESDPVEVSIISNEIPGGKETILLVEDEPIVRDYANKLLKRLGYNVFSCAGGQEALMVINEQSCEFNLLMTDVVMPGMNGRELAEKVKAECKEIKVLFTSGYTEDVVVHHGVLEAGLNFIGKPYTPQMLAQKIRRALDGE
jgi:CheY-like chemotaxis protein